MHVTLTLHVKSVEMDEAPIGTSSFHQCAKLLSLLFLSFHFAAAATRDIEEKAVVALHAKHKKKERKKPRNK